MGNIIRMTGFLAAGLAAGFVLSKWAASDAPGVAAAGHLPVETGARPTEARADVERRLAALERALSQETGRREALEGELAALRELVAGSVAGSPSRPPAESSVAAGRAAEPATGVGAEGAFPAFRRTAAGFRDAAADPDGWRVGRLVGAGFSPDRAEWINRRIEELRMQALEDDYRAARGEDVAPGRPRSFDAGLRGELGEQEYERYLAALGRPTSIGVRDVLAGSPAENAGLLPGDEVVGYDGVRVFDQSDLNRLTLEGSPGESVLLEVVRDGQQVQLYVPRGPLGIMGGGRFRRRP